VRYALFTFVGLSLLVVGNAEGQRNCRKGLPCGNTCIAANRVCHVGTPATPPSTPLASAVAPKDGQQRMGRFLAGAHLLSTRMQHSEPPVACKPHLLPYGRRGAAGWL